MYNTRLRGSFQLSITTEDPMVSSDAAMEEALAVLQARKDAWAACSIDEQIAMIDRLVKDFYAAVPHIIETEMQVKGANGSDSSYTTETIGAYTVLHNLNNLKRSLRDIQSHGAPRIPGRVSVRPNGQTAAKIFPETNKERAMFQGYSIEVWMEPGVTPENLPRTQSAAYHEKIQPGKVSLVLGAGNLFYIPLTDALYKLFVEKRVVLIKMNPVNALVGPIFEKGFRALIEKGFLRIVYGGGSQGSYLCQHPSVDEIHITGSDKSFETIVYGAGPEGALRKAARQPLIDKPVTGELGNITPVIIVPGPWTPAQMDYQADRIASWLGNNAGFTCTAPHLIVTHAGWPLRQSFLDTLRRKLASMPLQNSYYPGADATHQRFIEQHPEAEFFGQSLDEGVTGALPWTLIASVSKDNPDDICFTSEGFCGMLVETLIAAESVPEFIERSVEFLNQQVWGTLSAGIFVHPASLKSPEIAAAVERAIEQLRYGTVSINMQTALVYVQPVCPWGSFPGQPLENIQSGAGWTHNTLMFGRPQKVVLRAPFMESPKSAFIFSRARLSHKISQQMVEMEVSPSLWKFLGILYTALRG